MGDVVGNVALKMVLDSTGLAQDISRVTQSTAASFDTLMRAQSRTMDSQMRAISQGVSGTLRGITGQISSAFTFSSAFFAGAVTVGYKFGESIIDGISSVLGTGVDIIGNALSATVNAAMDIAAAGLDFTKLSVTAASEYDSAMAGLKSVAQAVGVDFADVDQFITEYTADGLINITDAAASLKNLLPTLRTGGTFDDLMKVMQAFKDAGSFSRQGSLELGEAVKGATEGVKNQNSILIDNVGITKNVSDMYATWAKQMGISTAAMTPEQKSLAILAGVMEEAALFEGNAALYADTFAGALSATEVATYTLQRTFGQYFLPYLKQIQYVMADSLQDLAAYTISYKNLGDTADKVIKAIQNIAVMAVPTLDAIASHLPNISRMFSPILDYLDSIDLKGMSIFDAIESAIHNNNLYQAVENTLSNVFDVLEGWVEKYVKPIVKNIGDLLVKYAPLFGEYVGRFISDGLQAIAFTVNLVRPIINKFIEGLKKGFNQASTYKAISSIVEDIFGVVSDNIGIVTEIGIKIFDAILDGLIAAKPKFEEAATAVIDALRTYLNSEDTYNKIQTIILTAVSTVTNFLGTLLPVILPAVTQLVSNVIDNVKSNSELMAQIKDAGAALIGFIWDGIKTPLMLALGVQTLYTVIGNVLSSVLTKVITSGMFTTAGASLGKLTIEGIRSALAVGSNNVLVSVLTIADKIKSGAAAAWTGIGSKLGGLFSNGLLAAVKNGLALAGAAIGAWQIAQNVSNSVSTDATGTGNTAANVAAGFAGNVSSGQGLLGGAGSTLANAAAYAGVGAGIGSVIPGLGTVAGAGIGAAVGAVGNIVGQVISNYNDTSTDWKGNAVTTGDVAGKSSSSTSSSSTPSSSTSSSSTSSSKTPGSLSDYGGDLQAWVNAHGYDLVSGHANGGLITRPVVSRLAEHGAEMVLPLTNSQRTNQLLNNAINRRMLGGNTRSSFSTNRDKDIYALQIGNSQFNAALAKAYNDTQRRIA